MPVVAVYGADSHKRLAELRLDKAQPIDAFAPPAVRTAAAAATASNASTRITSISFVPGDAHQLLVACSDGQLLLWVDILGQDSPCVSLLHAYDDSIHHTAVSYNGMYVASSTSRQVLVHELRSDRQMLQLQHANLTKELRNQL
jgi:WD40 repeat protein